MQTIPSNIISQTLLPTKPEIPAKDPYLFAIIITYKSVITMKILKTKINFYQLWVYR